MVVAVIATLTLLLSAVATGAKATASDDGKRGVWGIIHWTRARHRPLNPHERRWQTALLSAKESDTRWRDLVAGIQALERQRGIDTSDSASEDPAPKQHNARWVEAAIVRLEGDSKE